MLLAVQNDSFILSSMILTEKNNNRSDQNSDSYNEWHWIAKVRWCEILYEND